MAQGNSASKFPLIIIALAIVMLGIGGYLFLNKSSSLPFTNNNPANSTSDSNVKSDSPIFGKLSSWDPQNWSTPKKTTETTGLGTFNGFQSSVELTSQNPTIKHFEDQEYLATLGYQPDPSLSADGPGSSIWGYSRMKNGQQEVVLFSYNTTPSSNAPDQPLQFDCPCQMKVSVFVSSPSQTSNSNPSSSTNPGSGNSTGLANPASQNCIAKGGTLAIQKDGAGGEYGLCNFEDNMACEEWALFNGNCPVGGVKTTGFDTIDQDYCAWLGGQTLAVTDSKCTLPNGKVCTTKALYNETCSAN